MRTLLFGLLLTGVLLGLMPARAATETSSEPLYTYDLTPINKYDLHSSAGKNNAWAEAHLVSAVQGLVNRTHPQLYIFYVTDNDVPGHVDKFWLTEMRTTGNWLRHRPLQPISSLSALLQRFRSSYNGIVLYDLKVPATSNVASTVAGCDSLLPIPYDPTPGSVYDRFVVHGPKLPVKVRLIRQDGASLFTGSETGSAKCDAYLWAKRKYLDTGKCSPSLLAFYLDSYWLTDPFSKNQPVQAHCLTNHDYFISRKAFFFDLSEWDDVRPNDDPNQPVGADYRTLLAILRSAYNGTHGKTMIHIAGFIPWAWKYPDPPGRFGEWRFVAIFSCFNAFLDADAPGLNAMANASIFTHFPLKPVYRQHKPSKADWIKKGYIDAQSHVVPHTYVSFYIGDYDAAAWMYEELPRIWSDPARGSVPLGWAFDPNLSERFPLGFDWTRKTATANDYFITGDSGAGYINPGYLDGKRLYSGLPPGDDVWANDCRYYYKKFDITLTGFLLQGDGPAASPEMLSDYASFSPDGIAGNNLPSARGLIAGSTCPYIEVESDMANADQIDESVDKVQKFVNSDPSGTPGFHYFRTILWSPTQLQQLIARTNTLPNTVVVDPYTLMGLMRQYYITKN